MLIKMCVKTATLTVDLYVSQMKNNGPYKIICYNDNEYRPYKMVCIMKHLQCAIIYFIFQNNQDNGTEFSIT